ncbi:NADH dehydrogenase (ubiquinone) B14.5 B subunit [Ptiloglossa arizonensis]|uniref:NADH dehydrogenase (ubiquinone) B14.5 B subunit n=1 Tax=Ptiloglossa arizonensis TaxID=3350558 RepID=UPI003F9F7B1A
MGEMENNSIQWAIDLLTKDSGYKPQFYNIYFGELLWGTFGFIAPFFWNYYRRRPLFSTLQHNVVTVVTGIGIGHIFQTWYDKRNSKNDALLVDYIKRHPNFFPEPRNRKYADILEPWYPIR